MGNTQSCPKSPLCRALLCIGSAPPAQDDGEWFDRRGGGRRKKRSRSKTSSASKMPPMPVVPEESVTCSDTIETNEESGTSFEPPESGGDVAESDATKSLSSQQSSSSLDSFNSDVTSERTSITKVKSKRLPKAKLTFVNGQFVDMSTKEGRALSKAASTEEGSGAIRGILTSVESGHCGIIGPSSSSMSKAAKSSPNLNYGVKKLRMASSLASSLNRSRSDSSAYSVSSVDSESTQGSTQSKSDAKEAVSSIVALGDDKFLTASKCDRAIKMWEVEKNDNGETSIQFICDFVGHNVGITALAKVDGKGRFLSASKDKQVKLWDSRYNRDDSGEDDAIVHRLLLATFDNIDQRRVADIAITENGSYVRPDDPLDMAMAASLMKKAVRRGSSSVQKAARERHIIGCTCEFATISKRHNAVKMWSVKQVEQADQPPDANVAEVKLEQELNHDAVVESIAAVPKKGMLLAGDRMGNVSLWRAGKNVFLPGNDRVWSCVRTFSWRPTAELTTVTESLEFAITSLSFLQGNKMFVSGSKAGNLRVWDVDGTKANGETVVNKEEICITGAHSLPITAVQQGPRVKGTGKSLSFSSASEDGKVLSFAIPDANNGVCNLGCFNVVNHGIMNRYFVDADLVGVTSLACLTLSNDKEVLITGSTINGNIHVLKTPRTPKQKDQDALILYHRSIEEENLTLHAIAVEIRNDVETVDKKQNMKTYKSCFPGSDIVSYFVDNQYAASRKDAVDLGRVLTTHLSVFECVSKKDKPLDDDSKSFYRWSSTSESVSDGSESSSLKKQCTAAN